MKLRGQRILLTLPTPPDMTVIVDDKLKEEIAKEYYAKADKLEVFMVGDLVSDIKKGDIVYVPVADLQQSDLVEIEGMKYAMINSLKIGIVWTQDETIYNPDTTDKA